MFDVSLGFLHVKVKANSPLDAILLARRELSNEYPRLWDVIHKAEESRFVVVEEVE